MVANEHARSTLKLAEDATEGDIIDTIHRLHTTTHLVKDTDGHTYERSAGEEVGVALDAWIREHHNTIFGQDVFKADGRHAHTDLEKGPASRTGLPAELKTTNITKPKSDGREDCKPSISFAYAKSKDYNGQSEFVIAKSGHVHQILIIRPTEEGSHKIRWPILVTSTPTSRQAFAKGVTQHSRTEGSIQRMVPLAGPAGTYDAALELVKEFGLHLAGFIVSTDPPPSYSLEPPAKLISKSKPRRWPKTEREAV